MIVRRKNAEAQPPTGDGQLTGSTIAGYRLRRSLDRPRGAYIAYEATKGSRHGRVVFKLIDERLSQDERFSSRLQADQPRLAAITHPGLVEVLDAGSSERGLYVVTALARRPTLAETLDAEGREFEYGALKLPRALRVLGQVADVLEVAHAMNLVHGCLQTHSIGLGSRDETFVDDFGLSRLQAGDDPYVGPALLYGAPEQFAGEPATPRSDVYGLAAVAYECLTGALPYWHGALSHDGKPPLPMARHSRELPPELDEPFARALSEEPDQRQAKVSELMRDLAATLVLWSGDSSSESYTAGRTRRQGGRRAPAPGKRVRETRDGVRRNVADVTVWNDGGAASAAPAARADAGGRSGSGSKRLGLIAATAVLLAAAAIAGVVIANRHRAEAPPDLPKTVRSGLIELTAPAEWKRTGDSEIAGLSFSQKPIALVAPDPESRGPTLAAGSVVAAGPSFVPLPVIASLAGGLPRPDLVTLGGGRALRYSGLRPRGSARLLTLYSVPTSDGVAMVSCSVPMTGAPAARQLARCERVAATLEIRGARPVEVIFSAQYGEVLTDILTRLNAVRARERANLRRRGRQPEAARSLALAYAEAGRALAATDPPPDAEMHTAIRRAFRRTRQAYAGLSAAAQRNDRLAYRRARQAVNDGERDIQASLQALNTLGYAAR